MRVRNRVTDKRKELGFQIKEETETQKERETRGLGGRGAFGWKILNDEEKKRA